MKRAAAGALALLLAACGGGNGYIEEYGGSEAVYQRIAALTDCGELQAEFDRAAENNDRAEPGSAAHSASLGYMKAADERMQDEGCYQ